jgi:hypothetical protein
MSAGQEYERNQRQKATACREESPQQVDAGGTRMMDNALWIPKRAVDLQLLLCVEAHCRYAGHKSFEAKLGRIR